MTYILDTNIIIDFLRGKDAAKIGISNIASQGALCISVITLGELLYGAHRSGKFTYTQKKIMLFLTDFSVTVLPLSSEIIQEYAKAKYILEKEGKKLDEFDLLIGATAVVNQGILLTDNLRHFRRFPGIAIA